MALTARSRRLPSAPAMLPHPTLDKLQTLRLHGMLKALNEQLKIPDIDSLSFEERLGLLVDRELTERDDKRLSSRLRQARLRHNACLEDLDYRSHRGLDKALILQLSSGQWLRDGLNVIIGGPTGVDKTWLSCALAHQACRDGYSVRYLRLPRLREELRLAHSDGRFAKLMSSYAKTDLLILDDWGLKLNVSESDNAQNLDLALSVAGYFRLKQQDALKIIEDFRTKVRLLWRPAAKKLGISVKEQGRMASAFRLAE